MKTESRTIPGIEVTVSRVVHFEAGDKLPTGRPHAFVYFITVQNGSSERITLLGRKWIVHGPGGRREVIEGDKIVGKTPCLSPGEHFSYNSFHTTSGDARAEGSFHGVDDSGGRVHVCIPPFEMNVPRANLA
ncbi:MAG TPA: ApaG domain [Opitutaceae bacterium]|nr:ApaG domain [Opitutaceae bacterium]